MSRTAMRADGGTSAGWPVSSRSASLILYPAGGNVLNCRMSSLCPRNGVETRLITLAVLVLREGGGAPGPGQAGMRARVPREDTVPMRAHAHLLFLKFFRMSLYRKSL